MDLTPGLDAIDCKILKELQQNARVPFAELARRVGLSNPAVIERVRKLEETRVITGYRAEIDPAKVGLPLRAIVKVSVAGDKLSMFAAHSKRLPEVIECHRVTGSESYIVHVAVRDVLHLEQVIDSMMPYVSTDTSMILASPVQRNCIIPNLQERSATRIGRKIVPRRSSDRIRKSSY